MIVCFCIEMTSSVVDTMFFYKINNLVRFLYPCTCHTIKPHYLPFDQYSYHISWIWKRKYPYQKASDVKIYFFKLELIFIPVYCSTFAASGQRWLHHHCGGYVVDACSLPFFSQWTLSEEIFLGMAGYLCWCPCDHAVPLYAPPITFSVQLQSLQKIPMNMSKSWVYSLSEVGNHMTWINHDVEV